MAGMYEGWSNIFESRELSVSWAVRNSGHATQWLLSMAIWKHWRVPHSPTNSAHWTTPSHKVNEWQYTGFISTNYASGMPAFTQPTLLPFAIIFLFCYTELAYHTHSYIFNYNQPHSLAVPNTDLKLTTLKFHYASAITQNISNKLVCSSFLSYMKCRTVILACTQYFQVHNFFWIGIRPVSSYTRSLRKLLATFLHTGFSYEWTGYIKLQQSVLIILK
jgi:hypothetical protein